MSTRPFQFSMRQLFVGVAFLAVAIRLLMILLETRFEGGLMTPILYFCVFIAGGAGIGCFTGNPLKGAIYGALGGFFLGIIVGLLIVPGMSAARE